MHVVDAQVHLWAENTTDRPWPTWGVARAHGPRFTAAQLLEILDEAGVARAVLVPPSWAGDSNDVCLEAARNHPDRFGVMGRFAVDGPRDPEIIRRWRDEPGMLGMRLMFSEERWRRWLYDGTADWVWEAAEDHAVPIAVWAPGLFDEFTDIARRHPDLRLVLDHLWLPKAMPVDEIDPAIDRLLGLAALPNVAVKASSLPSVVTEDYPFPSLHERISRVVEAFGPERTFWGSDVTKLDCSYQENLELFTRNLPFLSDDDLSLIMGRGIEAWLGWGR